jgi:hypothetical protein
MALFGCAPKRPLDYSGRAGLIWAMNGGRLVELHRDWAAAAGVVAYARVAPPAPVREVPGGYLFLVADCALRSASSAHAIHAAAISINTALSFATLGPPDACILPRIGGSAQRHSP